MNEVKEIPAAWLDGYIHAWDLQINLNPFMPRKQCEEFQLYEEGYKDGLHDREQ